MKLPETRDQWDAFEDVFRAASPAERCAVAADITLSDEAADRMASLMERGLRQGRYGFTGYSAFVQTMLANPALTFHRAVSVLHDALSLLSGETKGVVAMKVWFAALGDNPAVPLWELSGEMDEPEGARDRAHLFDMLRQRVLHLVKADHDFPWVRGGQQPKLWPELDKMIAVLRKHNCLSDANYVRQSIRFIRDTPLNEQHLIESDIEGLLTHLSFDSAKLAREEPQRAATRALWLATMLRLTNPKRFYETLEAPTFWRVIEHFSDYKAPEWFWQPRPRADKKGAAR